jgi:hypothetical protein
MSADDYRPFLPPIGAKIAGPTARAHTQARIASPRAQGLFANWERLFAEPFRGITTDGSVIPDLYAPRAEGAPTQAMVATAQALRRNCRPNSERRRVFPLARRCGGAGRTPSFMSSTTACGSTKLASRHVMR